MAVYKIPLIVGTPQSLNVIFGVTEYRLRLLYRDAPEGGWTLDIIDSVSNTELVCGIPLVTGTDLLRQYRHLGITGSLVAFTDSDPAETPPTFDNLGGSSNLYFVVP